MKKLSTILCFFVFGIGSLMAAPAAERVLRFDNEDEPITLDPGLAETAVEVNILTNLFEGLTEYEATTGNPIPSGATHWEITKDGLTYTFHLRKEAKWSDGTPVTARDYEYAWKRTLDPKTASEYAFILYYLKNGQEYNEGKIKDPNQVGVTALDDYTLKVVLENPAPFFLGITSYTALRPVKKEVVDKFGETWIRPGTMISNGPYQLQSWTPQKNVVIGKNPFYWDAENVKIASAEFLPLSDRLTAIKKYQAGELDIVQRIPGNLIPEMKKRSDFMISPQNAMFFFSFNASRAPFNNEKVRQAFAMSIDRQKITDHILQGGEKPVGHFVPDGIPGYRSIYDIPFDPKRAKELLNEAGFADVSKLPPVEFIYNKDVNYQRVAEAVQQMWKEHLGVTVSLRNMDWKTLVTTRNLGDFQVARDRWIGDYMDPNTYLETMISDSPINYKQWSNKKYDSLLQEAGKELNPQKRMEFLAKAEKILLEEAALIPIAIYASNHLVNPKVKGFYGNLIDMHPLKFVSWEE